MNTGATGLGNWLKFHGEQVDHLRLQKLLFYCFGAAIAHETAAELGDIRFHAWKHGPVNVEVYHAHSVFGAAILPKPRADEVPGYSTQLTQVLQDVLAVYGRLSSWQLREESHEEAPWIETKQSDEIAPELVRQHFARKFALGQVELPKQLLRSWSFDVDRVPVQKWQTLRSLACALEA